MRFPPMYVSHLIFIEKNDSRILRNHSHHSDHRFMIVILVIVRRTFSFSTHMKRPSFRIVLRSDDTTEGFRASGCRDSTREMVIIRP